MRGDGAHRLGRAQTGGVPLWCAQSGQQICELFSLPTRDAANIGHALSSASLATLHAVFAAGNPAYPLEW